jgi:CRISPR-associated protein Cas2
MNIVVAYDVSDDQSRAQLSAFLSIYGSRIQKSVYMCLVDDVSLDLLRERVDQLIDHDHDVVHVFFECVGCNAKQLRFGQAHQPLKDYWWIV